jgi:hypothetical protein
MRINGQDRPAGGGRRGAIPGSLRQPSGRAGGQRETLVAEGSVANRACAINDQVTNSF